MLRIVRASVCSVGLQATAARLGRDRRPVIHVDNLINAAPLADRFRGVLRLPWLEIPVLDAAYGSVQGAARVARPRCLFRIACFPLLPRHVHSAVQLRTRPCRRPQSGGARAGSQKTGNPIPRQHTGRLPLVFGSGPHSGPAPMARFVAD